ncbi:MAG: RpiB/LacA/LacB family sugar-phosphate isomerase, partial [Actinomyces sp.]|nr:RpiB/LacA/LacB family sugar-phosphate isomerase [Actinomyces sp.]
MGFRIVLAADEAGVGYKETIKADLEADPRVDEIIDVGIVPGEKIAYPHM